jgi:hypothetical protein
MADNITPTAGEKKRLANKVHQKPSLVLGVKMAATNDAKTHQPPRNKIMNKVFGEQPI